MSSFCSALFNDLVVPLIHIAYQMYSRLICHPHRSGIGGKVHLADSLQNAELLELRYSAFDAKTGDSPSKLHSGSCLLSVELYPSLVEDMAYLDVSGGVFPYGQPYLASSLLVLRSGRISYVCRVCGKRKDGLVSTCGLASCYAARKQNDTLNHQDILPRVR